MKMHRIQGLFYYEIMKFVKNPLQIFFVVIFPVSWILISGTIWKDSLVNNQIHYIDYMFPPFLVMVILVLTLNNIPLNLSMSRENKIIKKLSILNVKKSEFVFSQYSINIITFIIMFLLLIAVGSTMFNLSINKNMVLLFLGSILIFTLFFCFGMFLGSIFDSFSPTLSTSLICFYVILFSSGCAIPAYIAGDWFTVLQKITPGGNGVLFLQQIFLGQTITSDLFPIIYCVIFTILIVPLSINRFKFI